MGERERPGSESECVFFSGDAARRAKVSGDGSQEPQQRQASAAALLFWGVGH